MEHRTLFFPDSGQTTASLRNIVTSGANRCQDLFLILRLEQSIQGLCGRNPNRIAVGLLPPSQQDRNRSEISQAAC